MHYSAYKERIIRIASHLFVRRGGLTEARVEFILRDCLNDEIMTDPSMSADHIRIGLVEFGLLDRDADGGRYRIDMDEFISESNICGIFGPEYPAERIKSAKQLVKKIVKYATSNKIIA